MSSQKKEKPSPDASSEACDSGQQLNPNPNEAELFQWTDIVSQDDVQQRVAATMIEEGYLLIKLPKALSKILNNVQNQSRQFFQHSTSDEKKQICCEYVGQNPRAMRDRLEIRLRRSGGQKIPFSALKRDQFASGYDAKAKDATADLVKQYFPDDNLVEAHTALEKVGNDLLALFCRFMGYSCYKSLKTCLKKETDTPGVLRLIRYIESPPIGSANGELLMDHTDIGLITLMPHSSSETLQILSKDFDWIDVEKGQASDTLVAIVGEQLAYLSNFTFRAVRHRIMPSPNCNTTRCSMPFLMRAPAEFQMLQNGTNKLRLSKLILNHVFEMPKPIQRRMKRAKHLHNLYLSLSEGKEPSSALLSVSIALPAIDDFKDRFWPIFLFFERFQPSSSELEAFREQLTSCGPMLPPSSLSSSLGAPSSFMRIEGKGFQVSQWPKSIISFEARTKGRKWLFFIVPLNLGAEADSKPETESITRSDDFSYSIRSTAVVTGRQALELVFDLNRYRLY